MTLVFDLVSKFPNASWNWEVLSGHSSITIKNVLDIKKNNEYGFSRLNWKLLSMNPGITPKDISDNLNLPWDLNMLQDNTNILMKNVLDFIGSTQLIKSDMYSVEYMLNHILCQWNWKEIFQRSDITLSDIKKINDKLSTREISKISSAYNKPYHNHMKVMIVEESGWIEKWVVSYSPHLTMEIILDEQHRLWDWDYISAHNKNITIQDIVNYPDKFNNWEKISANLNISLKDIKNNMTLPWNWQMLSSRPDLTAEFVIWVCNNPTYDSLLYRFLNMPNNLWDWGNISTNKGDFGYKSKVCKILSDRFDEYDKRISVVILNYII